MSWKRSILAALCFAVLVLLYVLDRQLAARAIIEAVQEASLAPGINLSEVVEISLRNQQGEVLLAKEQNQWRVKVPVEASADTDSIEQLLINVTGARKRNDIEVKNLAEYGLAAPDISLRLKTDTGKTFELLLGNESTYTGQIFAKYPRTADKRTNVVFTVGEHVKNVLVRGPLEFRRSRLMEVDLAKIDTYSIISINTPAHAVVLQNDRGTWRLTSPVESPAEGQVVEDYLRKLGLLRANSFVTEKSDKPTSMAAAVQALTSPTLSVTLERSNGPLRRLLVANAGTASKPVHVAQRMGDSEVLVLRPETLNALDQDENYFRARSIFALKPEDVGMFSIEIGKARTDLGRNEKGIWEFVGDPDRRVDQYQVGIRLESLLRGRVKDFVEINPRDLQVYDLQPPRFKFTVTSKDKARTEGIETGRSVTGSPTTIYARRRGDNSVFTMELSSELIILPENVADRRFASINPDAIDHFDMEIAEQRYSFKHEGDEWKVLRPTQQTYTTADSTKLLKFLGMLNSVEYEKDYSASGETVIAPTESATMIMRFFGKGDNQLLELTVGKRLQTTTFVKTGKDRTYEVSNNDIDAIQAAAQSVAQ